VTLCAFDLIELDGRDLRREPLERRKAVAIASAASSIASASSMRSATRMPRARPICA
jgi:ATP-dependent DNA ligase